MQEAIVYLIIAAAFIYVLYSLVQKARMKKSSGCSGCDGCALKIQLNCSKPTFERKS